MIENPTGIRGPSSSGEGLVIAPVEYTCRVCGRDTTAYVAPIETDEGRVVDLASRHRLCEGDCPDCEQSRTWVATRTLRAAAREEGSD